MFLKWVNKLNRIFEISIGIAFGFMTLFVFIQVLVRFIFTKFDINISVPWTEELSRFIMIWAVFIGAAVAMRKDNMIQVDALVNALPGALGKVLKIIGLIFTAIFFGFLVFVGYKFVLQGTGHTSPVMDIPMAIAFLSIPVGSAIVILNIVALFVESIQTKKDIRFVSDAEGEEYLEELKES